MHRGNDKTMALTKPDTDAAEDCLHNEPEHACKADVPRGGAPFTNDHARCHHDRKNSHYPPRTRWKYW